MKFELKWNSGFFANHAPDFGKLSGEILHNFGD